MTRLLVWRVVMIDNTSMTVQKCFKLKATIRRNVLASCLFGFLLISLHAEGAFLIQCTIRTPFFRKFATNGEEGVMSQNQLTHIMLRVPNVNATVDFWKERGANIRSYRMTYKAETAFVGYGKGKGYFSLEITKQPENESFQLGNAVQYFGLSMLMGMNLMMAAAGEKSSTKVEQDPNGIEVRPVASAPGDSFARLCLLCASKEDIFSETKDFYEALGMELVAADDNLICLRYPNVDDSIKRTGVATTLVFQKSPYELDIGNCFDHMAISTMNRDAAAQVLRETLENPDDVIFLEPCLMFGTKVMGLQDPNGYKVYLVEQKALSEGSSM